MRIFFRLLMISAAMTGAALAAQRGAPPWSENGRFAFGDAILDFKSGNEMLGSLVSHDPINCSNAEFYCVYTNQIFNLALPKQCAAVHVGDVWGVGSIETAVLREVREGAGRTLYLLGNERWPFTVFEYEPKTGVRALYFDRTRTTDLVDLAAKGPIPASYRQKKSGDANQYFQLTSPDPFGPCKPG